MTKEQKCIVEMYRMLDEIVERAKKHDFSLLRPVGIGGCDMYHGAPIICRAFDGLSTDYSDILHKAFKEYEYEQMETIQQNN